MGFIVFWGAQDRFPCRAFRGGNPRRVVDGEQVRHHHSSTPSFITVRNGRKKKTSRKDGGRRREGKGHAQADAGEGRDSLKWTPTIDRRDGAVSFKRRRTGKGGDMEMAYRFISIELLNAGGRIQSVELSGGRFCSGAAFEGSRCDPRKPKTYEDIGAV